MGSRDRGKKSKTSKAKAAYAKANWASPTGTITNIVKLILKKKNTNVGKAGKEKRRARIDKREAGKRTEAQQAKVDARRQKIDAKDKKRWTKNPKARARVQRKVDRMNKNRGTSYKGPQGLFED